MKQQFRGNDRRHLLADFLTLSALVAVLATASGCEIIRNAVRANEAQRLGALEADGDYAGLARTCEKPRHDEACKAKRRVGMQRVAASTCDDILGNIEAYYAHGLGTKESDLALGRKLTECELTASLVDGSLSLRHHEATLAALDAEREDVFEAFVAFVASQEAAYDVVGQGYVEMLADWLAGAAKPERCPRVHEELGHLSASTHGEILRAFHQLGCKEESLPLALDELTAKAAHRRALACRVLGEFGDVSVLPKLEALAETDPYNEAREVRSQQHGELIAVDKVYPVRARCLEAVGKVRLRN